MSDPDLLASTIEHARWFAALSGPFDPTDALNASMQQNPATGSETALLVASQLSRACDTQADASGSHWLMRGTERRWDIENLRKSDRLDDALTWRSRQSPFDDAARDVVAALRGVDAFAVPALDAVLAASEQELISGREQLNQLTFGLEWAGPAAPGYSRLERLRAAVMRTDDKRRSDTLLTNGFHGRDQQRRVLQDWLAAPINTPPVHALFVTGLPGIGKSALLETAISERVAAQRITIVVRLDFDRPTLDMLDQVGLTLELARQIAAQLPEQAATVRELRLKASGGSSETLKGRGRESIPSELVSMLGAALRSAAATVAVVLDTCEVLRGRGETHPQRLFEWLDTLVRLGLAPMVVIAAGRGDAFDSVPERTANRLHLAELAPKDAELLLEASAVPVAVRSDILAFAKGNPLMLRLSGAAAVSQPDLIRTTAKRRSRNYQKDLSAAHLYRFLLSRIPDPDLQRLANPGLLVRRISVGVISDVLAPQVGLRRIGERRAKRLFEELKTLSWLIVPDTTGGWLLQDPRMRAELVPLLYANRPAQCAKVDRAAADWFERRKGPVGAVEALYHCLQLMRRGQAAPKINRDVALQFDEATLAELPPAARDAVLQARGQRSTAARANVASQPGQADSRVVKDLQYAIERGDWREAADLYARALENVEIVPTTEAGDAVRTLLWRTGRWRQAKKALQTFDAKLHAGDDDIDRIRAEDAFARIEMRAEFGFRKLTTRLSDPAWREKIQNVVSRGAKFEMSAGALGFALRAAAISIEASWRTVDPVAATFELWASVGYGTALATAMAHAGSRIGNRLPQAMEWMQHASRFNDWGRADLGDPNTVRRLAVYSPYAHPLGVAAQLDQTRRLATHARNSLAALTKLDLTSNSGIAGLDVAPYGPPQEPVEILADLGLVNEWAGAAAFVLGGQDIRLIAKSAEAWRRSIAGLWGYRLPPVSWQDPTIGPGVDVLSWDRTRELLSAKDPIVVSQSVIAAWTGSDTALPDRARERLTAFVGAARRATARKKGEKRALEAVRILTRAGAPAAFLPALAVLAVSGRQRGGAALF